MFSCLIFETNIVFIPTLLRNWHFPYRWIPRNCAIETERLLVRAILTGKLIESTHAYAIVATSWNHDVITTTRVRVRRCARIALRIPAGFPLRPVFLSFCLPRWSDRREPIADTFDLLFKAIGLCPGFVDRISSWISSCNYSEGGLYELSAICSSIVFISCQKRSSPLTMGKKTFFILKTTNIRPRERKNCWIKFFDSTVRFWENRFWIRCQKK